MEPSDTLQPRTTKSKREREKVTPGAPLPKIANGSTGLKKGNACTITVVQLKQGKKERITKRANVDKNPR